MKDAPTNSIGFLLQDVARILRRNFNRNIHDLELTQAQWQVLVYVFHHPGIRQAQLAEMLEMQPISIARLIDRMEGSGWVRRTPDPADRRAVNLYLEDKAEPILKTLRTRGAATLKHAFQGISEEDQAIVLNILQRMRGNLISE